MDENRAIWKQCAEFHGHECGGLTIGYKAALYALQLLEMDFEEDKQAVCISETDACSVDAIRAILGCTEEKGNLYLQLTGRQAFAIGNRKNGKAVRLVLKPMPEGMTRAESFGYFQNLAPEKMFYVEEAPAILL